jgi:hypothetical protein
MQTNAGLVTADCLSKLSPNRPLCYTPEYHEVNPLKLTASWRFYVLVPWMVRRVYRLCMCGDNIL